MKQQKRTFESKLWKRSAILLFFTMQVGAIFVTGLLPLTVIGMGEGSDGPTLAEHCYSLKKIQYWLLGVGGFTLLISTFSLVATMSNSRVFRIVLAVLLCILIIPTFSIMISGLAETTSRKSYFQATWDDMSAATKNFIQTYFSCCGFENSTEWNTGAQSPGSSCYAIQAQNVEWPDGCYERVISVTLPAVSVVNSSGLIESIGTEKMNPFMFSFLFSFIALLAAQSVSAGFFIYALAKTAERAAEGDTVVLENPYVNRKGESIGNSSHDGTHAAHYETGTVNVITENIQITQDGTPVAHCKTEAVTIMAENIQISESKPWHLKYADGISRGLESAFHWLGVRVARHPKMTILCSVLMTATFAIGILQRYENTASAATGFLADDNQVVLEAAMTRNNFAVTERDQYILVVDESNVLTTESFQTALNIDKSIKELSSSTNANLSTICLTVNGVCKQRSLFEFWSFNNTVLETQTANNILTTINASPLTSPVFGDNVNISHVIGGIIEDNSGNVATAKAHLMHYVTTSIGDDWEDKFIEIGRQSYSGVSVYVQARSSRVTEGSSQFTNELPLLFAGFCLIFIYIIVMAGKFSLLEHRAYIALMGVVAAGLSMAGGIGLTPAFGLKWTVLHLIVPFLVIGIGVDDMFVLLQTWNAVEDDPNMKNKSIEEKSGRALQLAGVSITITSVTDLVAFAIGGTSELGGFASFSIFVAVCIIILFALQCTFFMACVVLDVKRRERRYDACLACCYKHDKSYKPGKCSEREFIATFFEDGLGRIVTKLPFGIIVILITLGLSGLMAWGFSNLKVRYDPDWYLPSSSYLVEYGDQYDTYFSTGVDAAVYVIGADFYTERAKLHILYENLQNNAELNPAYTTSWFEDYITWAASEKGINNVYDSNAYANAAAFHSSVSEFVASTNGGKHAPDVSFNFGLIVASRFRIRHRETAEQAENIEMISSIRTNCEAAGFSSSTSVFPYGGFYLIYEITRIVRNEVYRNLGITLLCVFVMVLPILASIQMGIWVALCVVFTTIDVAGSMYFAGLSIESSTIITLLLSVGLAVDYGAHIGHKFLTLKGSRKKRIRVAVGQIGIAVFNGGFSTFLALVLLAGSKTYTYKIFFTIFACVVGYGLWNGLVFLPCVLAIIGPPPHVTATEAHLSSRHYRQKNKIENSETSSDVQTTESNENGAF